MRRVVDALAPPDLRSVLRMAGAGRDFVLGALLAVLSAWGIVAAPWLIGKAVNELKRTSTEHLALVALSVAGAGLLTAVLSGAALWLLGRFAAAAGARIRDLLYDHLLVASLDLFRAEPTGQLVARTTADVEPIKLLLTGGVSVFAQLAGTIGFAIVVMLLIDPELAGIALIPLPVAIAVQLLYGARTRAATVQAEERRGIVATEAADDVRAARLIFALGLEGRERAQFARAVAALFRGYTSGGAALDKINTVLDEEPSVRDAPDAQPLAPGPGEVRFEHVSFGYDAGREVLHDIDLVLAPGPATAIVGHNGAGKSTLVNLLARFYHPDHGRVLLDGQDVRTVTQASLRRAIGYSLQDTNMLTGTVRDNLRLAKADATDAELERTLQELGGLEIVRRLPDGLDTRLGSSGAALSPGQLQVIALARTVLSGASIFILDEFTSGVDVLTEARLLDGLERLLEGRTRVVIAHRLHMVERADHVVVVDDGRVVEQGAHASLLATDGAYARLWRAVATDRRIVPHGKESL